jgi:hypothetical protein
MMTSEQAASLVGQGFALVELGLGEKGKAIDWLEKELRETNRSK